MKFICVLILMITQVLGHSQNLPEPYLSPLHPIDTIQSEIILNSSIDTTKCGFWDSGDYRIYLEIPPLEQMLQKEYSGLTHSMENKISNDSATLIAYKTYAERYLNAIHQLRGANRGFDLRQLILYVGPENTERNKGNSVEVELYVKQLVERGHVVMLYKGQRIYKLKCRIVKDYTMSTINIYFDNTKNSAFSYFGYINW